jgi:hypothetical protein
MVIGTILAPRLISTSLTKGTNFAAGMVGAVASSVTQRAANAATTAGAMGGMAAGAAVAHKH